LARLVSLLTNFLASLAVFDQNLQTGLDPLFPDSYSINERKRGRPYMNSGKLLKFLSLCVSSSNVFILKAPGFEMKHGDCLA
jgi:hypothetical protein